MTTYRMDPQPDVDTVWAVRPVTRGGAQVALTRKRSPLGIRWRTPSGPSYTWPQVLAWCERVTDVNPDPLAGYPLPWTYADGRIRAANGNPVADMVTPTYETDAPLAALIVEAVNAHTAQDAAREATQ